MSVLNSYRNNLSDRLKMLFRSEDVLFVVYLDDGTSFTNGEWQAGKKKIIDDLNDKVMVLEIKLDVESMREVAYVLANSLNSSFEELITGGFKRDKFERMINKLTEIESFSQRLADYLNKINLLNKRALTCVTYYCFLGLSFQEISKVMGLSVNSVRKIFNAAISGLLFTYETEFLSREGLI